MYKHRPSSHRLTAALLRASLMAVAIVLLALSCTPPQTVDETPTFPEEVLTRPSDVSDRCSLQSPIPWVMVSSASNLPPEDRTKIDADFRFYDTADPNGWYSASGAYQDGSGTIHARGQGSLGFPKKSFSINLGKENGLLLMDMPRSHKWVMIGNWVDTTHLANKMSYDMYAQMGHFGPESRHVQVCFNGQYWGLYTFGEKVNRGEGRVKTEKASMGGFIVKEVDTDPEFCSETDREFQYEYPAIEDASDAQTKAIRDFINEYETRVVEGGDWRELLNEEAEIDYFILADAFANPDGYFNDKNLFYFKNLDNELEPVIWDFIWAFGPPFYVEQGNNPGIWPSIDRGNALMYGNTNYRYQVGYNQFCLMQFYMADKRNIEQFKARYERLRKGVLSNDNVNARWEALVKPLNLPVPSLGLGVYQIDENRWDGWFSSDDPNWPTTRFSPEEFRDRLILRLEVMDEKVSALTEQSLTGSCPLSPPRHYCPSH